MSQMWDALSRPVTPRALSRFSKYFVALFEELGARPLGRLAWNVESRSGYLLEPMTQHRSVNLFEDVLSDLDDTRGFEGDRDSRGTDPIDRNKTK